MGGLGVFYGLLGPSRIKSALGSLAREAGQMKGGGMRRLAAVEGVLDEDLRVMINFLLFFSSVGNL